MDPIEELRQIILNHTATDGIASVSLAPWAWLLLLDSRPIISFTDSGFELGKFGESITRDVLMLTIDPQQEKAFRLWGRNGEEVKPAGD